eukprot:4547412-Prymnesium_polylepis.2
MKYYGFPKIPHCPVLVLTDRAERGHVAQVLTHQSRENPPGPCDLAGALVLSAPRLCGLSRSGLGRAR